MTRREFRVKWLDAEHGGVFRESLGVHQCDGPESPDVAVVKRPSVPELEAHGRIVQQLARKRTVVDEQCAGEPRLHHDTVARRKVEHYELRSTPRMLDTRARDAFRECPRGHLAQYVRPGRSEEH